MVKVRLGAMTSVLFETSTRFGALNVEPAACVTTEFVRLTSAGRSTVEPAPGENAAPLALVSGSALAETFEEQCKREMLPHLDFPQLGRYRDDNARLLASHAPVDVVFMGDSITEGWKDKRPGFFTAGRIDRGISGQTTPQMVLRMMADVVDLKPAAVIVKTPCYPLALVPPPQQALENGRWHTAEESGRTVCSFIDAEGLVAGFGLSHHEAASRQVLMAELGKTPETGNAG